VPAQPKTCSAVENFSIKKFHKKLSASLLLQPPLKKFVLY